MTFVLTQYLKLSQLVTVSILKVGLYIIFLFLMFIHRNGVINHNWSPADLAWDVCSDRIGPGCLPHPFPFFVLLPRFPCDLLLPWIFLWDLPNSFSSSDTISKFTFSRSLTSFFLFWSTIIVAGKKAVLNWQIVMCEWFKPS